MNRSELEELNSGDKKFVDSYLKFHHKAIHNIDGTNTLTT